jgi:N-acetylmuramoyl-L-alanine amidase
MAEALAAANGDLLPAPGGWIEAPPALLSEELRSLMLRNVFPQDHLDDNDWIHVARAGALPTYDVGLWQVAQWFCGSGTRFEELRQVNGLNSPELVAGQRIRIPAAILLPGLRALPRSEDGSLEFSSDDAGEFALYRLRPGEALYSAVVMRFTGRTSAEDVRALAETIATRSGIGDLHDIPRYWPVRIPLELVEPELLPPEHPLHRRAEARREELARELIREPVALGATGLSGVVVIIDPGHGGRDLGTMNHGIWEHDYVYDVACRLKQLLEVASAARVHLTLLDAETGCAPSSGDRLESNRQGTIQTAPPFLAREIGEADIAVNLRWYLANSIYRRALREGTSRDRVVFLSLHADARHPSLRGLMVYVPGAEYLRTSYGQKAALYRKFAEVREKPTISFTRAERVRSEAVSRQLADTIVRSFQEAQLPVAPFQPVREKVIRGKQRWVPAVLGGNAVPSKVLVELLNLSNGDDAALLASARQRERLARGLFQALHHHFGERPPQMARVEPVGATDRPGHP